MDSVEIVLNLEREFGISIPDRDAERLLTVGEIVEYVRSRVQLDSTTRCQTATRFYAIRRVLCDCFGFSRSRVRPSAIVEDLVPRPIRRRVWRQLARHGLGVPALSPSDYLCYGMMGAGALMGFLYSVVTRDLTNTADEPILKFIVSATFAGGFLGLLALLTISRPYHRTLPVPRMTVGHLTRMARWREHSKDQHVASDSEVVTTDRHVKLRVREIIAETLGCAVQEVTEEKNLVRDLGLN